MRTYNEWDICNRYTYYAYMMFREHSWELRTCHAYILCVHIMRTYNEWDICKRYTYYAYMLFREHSWKLHTYHAYILCVHIMNGIYANAIHIMRTCCLGSTAGNCVHIIEEWADWRQAVTECTSSLSHTLHSLCFCAVRNCACVCIHPSYLKHSFFCACVYLSQLFVCMGLTPFVSVLYATATWS